jgi:hypothetical protein
MSHVSDAIAKYSQDPKLGDILWRTTYRTLFVEGVWAAGQVVHGRLNPNVPLDFSSPAARSESYVGRYGDGAGVAFKLDENVGKSISAVPDARHALMGLGLEEGTYEPAEAALALLGVTRLTAEDEVDLHACLDFQNKVLRCADMGIELGTDPSLWPKPAPWHPPTQQPAAPAATATVKAPAATAPASTAKAPAASPAPAAQNVDAAKAQLLELHAWVVGHGGQPMRHVQQTLDKVLNLL